ncbi:MAG: hypothetical protein II466_05375 [Bacteroidales bacterium]|nr:hypothetical protein [Bacteroidales bacterium]
MTGKIIISALTAVLASFTAAGQDSLLVRLYDKAQPIKAEAFTPALTDVSMLFVPWMAGTTTEALYNFSRQGKAVFTQNGKGLDMGEFKASSLKFLRKDRAVKGSVSYQRGVKKDVCWNTSSDYELLYPYVMADTVGGKLQMEQYAFAGAYAGSIGEWKYGIGGSYRALHEYRQTDPRPRNITSDLSLRLSAGRVFGHYILSASASYRRYHQLQSVTFLSPKGANTAEFHLTGLGTHYARLAGTGTLTNLRFRGNGFSTAIQLQKDTAEGLSASAEYSQFQYVRHLPNQNEVPYSKLLTQNVNAFAAYRGRIGGKLLYGLRLNLGYELRQGDEAIIPNTIASGAEGLKYLTLYRNRMPSAELTGLVQTQAAGGTLSFEAGTGYNASDAVRKGADNRMKIQSVRGFGALGLAFTKGRIMTDVKLAFGMTAHPGCSIFLPLRTERFLEKHYIAMYDRLKETSFDFRLTGKLACSLGKIALTIKPDATVIRWNSGAYALTGSIGAGIEF